MPDIDQTIDEQEPVDQANVRLWGWTPTGQLETARELPRVVRLQDSRDWIIVGGGSELLSIACDTTEIFSEESRSWRPGPKLHYPHRDAELVTLPDGSLLVIGGSDGLTKVGSRNVERLLPGATECAQCSPLRDARTSHAACVLRDGRVIVTGGQSDPETFLDTCEIYDPQTDRWDEALPLAEVRATHHLRLLTDGRVIAIGGGTDITATRTVEIFDPDSGQWAPTAPMRNPRWGFASALMRDSGEILVAGGRVPAQKGASISEDQMVILRDTEIYNPTTERWRRACPMNRARTMGIPNVSLAILPNGGLLFPGGREYPAPYHGSATAEYYDINNDEWNMLAPMRVGASYHAFVPLSDGTILAAGGRGPRFLPLRRSQVFSLQG